VVAATEAAIGKTWPRGRQRTFGRGVVAGRGGGRAVAADSVPAGVIPPSKYASRKLANLAVGDRGPDRVVIAAAVAAIRSAWL